MLLQGVGSALRLKRSTAILHAMGLEELLDRQTYQMSGGQKQRVAVARAVVAEPRLILADEPTGNLDTKTGKDIMGLMKSLNEEKGTTVVLVTHNEEMREFATRTIRMRDGKIEKGS